MRKLRLLDIWGAPRAPANNKHLTEQHFSPPLPGIPDNLPSLTYLRWLDMEEQALDIIKSIKQN